VEGLKQPFPYVVFPARSRKLKEEPVEAEEGQMKQGHGLQKSIKSMVRLEVLRKEAHNGAKLLVRVHI